MAGLTFRDAILVRTPCGSALVWSRFGRRLGDVLPDVGMGVVASNRVDIGLMVVQGGFRARGEPYLDQ